LDFCKLEFVLGKISKWVQIIWQNAVSRRISEGQPLPGIATGRWANAAIGTAVYLETYGIVKVFRIISRDGTAERWATNESGTAGTSPLAGF